MVGLVDVKCIIPPIVKIVVGFALLRKCANSFETEAEAGAPLLSEHPKPRVVSLEGDVERKRGEAADGGRAGAVIRSH